MATIHFERPAYVKAYAVCAGKKEGAGPLGDRFDVVCPDGWYGEKSWEKAEMKMVSTAWRTALQKGGVSPAELGCALGGDLLNQCVSTSFGMRESGIPFLGLYGACSTMAESLLIGSSFISGGVQDYVLCTASSHFCSAERQYRYPLAYGGQRPPTAQWTASAAAAVVLTKETQKVKITRAHIGKIYDPGVTDANNMGAAMAQSAYETISSYFSDTGDKPEDYDIIVTGDLASIGKQLVLDLFDGDGVNMRPVYDDCGLMLFHGGQDVHAGASGCGCSAAVLGGYLLPALEKGIFKKILFCGTGALLSPITSTQGESIPGICHLICLESEVK